MDNSDFIYDYEQASLILLLLGVFLFIIGVWYFFYLLSFKSSKSKSKTEVSVIKPEPPIKTTKVDDIRFTDWLKTKAKKWDVDSKEPPI